MNIGSNGKVLSAATTDLWRKWQRTTESWCDGKSEEFERRFLVELQAAVDRAGVVLDHMAKIVNQARQDCE